MSRQPIKDDIQNEVLLRGRRRCCLCFWLDGLDEVVKGQIAHLDQDNTNPTFENLVFLCLEHHGEFDSKTSQSKGLREHEVRRWRDELYKEMEYRFRTVRRKELKLEFDSLAVYVTGLASVRFRVTNSGEVTLRTPRVAIRLPEGILGEVPRIPRRHRGPGFVQAADFHIPSPTDATEERQNFFEERGKAAVITPCHPSDPVLHVGYSETFDAHTIDLGTQPAGTDLVLDYRLTAEEMEPITGQIAVPLLFDDLTRLIGLTDEREVELGVHFGGVDGFFEWINKSKNAATLEAESSDEDDW